MNTRFTNSENIKVFDPHRLSLDILDKISLQKSDKYVALSNLTTTYKNIQKGIQKWYI